MFFTIKLKKLILFSILVLSVAIVTGFVIHKYSDKRLIGVVQEEMRLAEFLPESAAYQNRETALDDSANTENSIIDITVNSEAVQNEQSEQTEQTEQAENSEGENAKNFDSNAAEGTTEKKDYIKWVDFDVCYEAMDKAFKLDVESQNSDIKLDWIEILAYLGTKYGGDFSKYKAKDMDLVCEKLTEGTPMSEIMKDNKYYGYYLEAYTAVLGEFVGEYKIERESENGDIYWEDRYGLKVFSPIAKDYGFSHYDDFGSSRSYGYKRKHLGHDLMGSVGTPIIAVESGIIQVMGWNQYGGWRIGIRSFDTKRYYYYAHLRKNHPYRNDLREGDIVKAGDVIGYLGMTGYSTTENVNNITTPHLHYGMQLIFDPSQEEGNGEIWIDLYDITKFVEKNKASVIKDEEKKEYYRKYNFHEPILDSGFNR